MIIPRVGVGASARFVMPQPISVEGDELAPPYLGFFGKPRLAQAVGVAGAVFRPPERRRHSFKTGSPKCGIALAQPGHRLPPLDDPIRQSIGDRRPTQRHSPVRLLVYRLRRPRCSLVVTSSEEECEGHTGVAHVSDRIERTQPPGLL